MKNIKEYLKSEDAEIILYHKNGGKALWYLEGKDGSWIEGTRDKNGMTLTYKTSNGYWYKYTRDEDGNELTFEDSYGNKRGFDIEEMTMEQVCKALGKTIKITK
tara:strand:+ start:17 stop:328 length:312 start_codon:yes stop_codon:yes gene_type:complete